MYENFRKLLDLNHLKVSDFSRLSGISQSTLSDWKQGRSIPKADKMQRIAECLNVSVEYLMTGENNTSFAMPSYNPVVHAIIEYYDKLTENQQNIILELMREFASINENLNNMENENKSLIENKKNTDEQDRIIEELEIENDELRKKLSDYEDWERFNVEE